MIIDRFSRSGGYPVQNSHAGRHCEGHRTAPFWQSPSLAPRRSRRLLPTCFLPRRSCVSFLPVGELVKAMSPLHRRRSLQSLTHLIVHNFSNLQNVHHFAPLRTQTQQMFKLFDTVYRCFDKRLFVYICPIRRFFFSTYCRDFAKLHRQRQDVKFIHRKIASSLSSSVSVGRKKLVLVAVTWTSKKRSLLPSREYDCSPGFPRTSFTLLTISA